MIFQIVPIELSTVDNSSATTTWYQNSENELNEGNLENILLNSNGELILDQQTCYIGDDFINEDLIGEKNNVIIDPMDDKVKIAGAQIKPLILDVNSNLNKCLEFTKEATSQGTKLVILPDAALTGYCYSSLEEAIPVAESIPGPSTEKIIALCQDLGTYVILGLIEKENDRYYNAAAFLGPEGLIGKYRKLHLPYLGVDRFLNHGNLPLTVYSTEIGRIGMGVCFDVMFPEHSRILALNGADIVVNITNFPGPTITPRILH